MQRAKDYSDAMDWSLAPRLEQMLTDCRFSREDLRQRLDAGDIGLEADIFGLLASSI